MRHRVRCKDINIETHLNPQSLQLWKQAQGGGYVQDILGSFVMSQRLGPSWFIFFRLDCLAKQDVMPEHQRTNQKANRRNKDRRTNLSNLSRRKVFPFHSISNHINVFIGKTGRCKYFYCFRKSCFAICKVSSRSLCFDGETSKNAEKIFQMIQDAAMLLDSEEIKQDLKLRLDAESRGLQYVSEADSNKADMIYTQGKILFRKQNFEQAGELLEKAFRLNPYNWRICHMKINCQINYSKWKRHCGTTKWRIQPEQGHED